MCDISHYNSDIEFDIVLYTTINGRVPFSDFVLSLDKPMQAKLIKCVDQLKTLGYKIREPLSKKVNDSIFELRVIQKNNICRVFYFFHSGKQIVLMNGYVKKSNKMAKNEIDKAIKYRNDWLRRNNNEV